MIKQQNNQNVEIRGGRGGKNRDTHTTIGSNKKGKQGVLCVCEKTPMRANYTNCQFSMPDIKEKQQSYAGNGNCFLTK